MELTLTGAGWPTERYGLAGNIVTCRDEDGATFTGLIRGNTATTLDVVWLQGRTPGPGTLEIWIGGVEFELVPAWVELGGDDAHTAVVRRLLLHTAGNATRIVAALRGARHPHYPYEQGFEEELEVTVGEDYERNMRRVNVRGFVHQVRLSSIRNAQTWELHGLTLGLAQTGARV